MFMISCLWEANYGFFLLWPPILRLLDKKGMVLAIVVLMLLNCIVPMNIMDGIFLYPKFLFCSIFFVAGYLLKNIDRAILSNKRYFGYAASLFLIFCVVFVQSIHVPYVWQYVLAFIGCWFVWSLSFQLLKSKPATEVLSFCGKNSLAYYWLNGFALVPARMLIVKILYIESTPMIAISIFLICVVSETIAILVIRRIPYLRTIVGIS